MYKEKIAIIMYNIFIIALYFVCFYGLIILYKVIK